MTDTMRGADARPLRNDGTPLEHVRFLVDDYGMYGLEVAALAGDDLPYEQQAITLISRPDKVAEANFSHVPSLFQAIPRRNTRWSAGRESYAAGLLQQHWLRERGMTHIDLTDTQTRRTYHGLGSSARAVISKLVRELYDATIPQPYLKLIRRYPIRLRDRLFVGLCTDGERAWQLAESFPFLATVIYASNADMGSTRELVIFGRKLAEVAASADVPISLRRLPPAVMRQALNLSSWLISHPDIIAHHAPATVPRLRVWLRTIRAASETKDREFVSWVAKHWESLGHWRGVDAIARDLGDWVEAGKAERALGGLDDTSFARVRDAVATSGAEGLAGMLQDWHSKSAAVVVGRPFSDRMAPRTVLRLSDDWHIRAARTRAINVPFPTPWYTGGDVGEFRIAPISNSVDLTRYAFALHNCASQYAHDIAADLFFLYVVLREDKPVAMLELVRDAGQKPQLRQLSGPCNGKADKVAEKAVRTWLRQRRKAEGNGRTSMLNQSEDGSDLDDDIPF